MDLGENFAAIEAAVEQSEHLHAFYTALLTQGFEDESAMLLTMAYMTKMIEVATKPRWWEIWK